jgi:hypothetical protein
MQASVDSKFNKTEPFLIFIILGTWAEVVAQW